MGLRVVNCQCVSTNHIPIYPMVHLAPCYLKKQLACSDSYKIVILSKLVQMIRPPSLPFLPPFSPPSRLLKLTIPFRGDFSSRQKRTNENQGHRFNREQYLFWFNNPGSLKSVLFCCCWLVSPLITQGAEGERARKIPIGTAERRRTE